MMILYSKRCAFLLLLLAVNTGWVLGQDSSLCQRHFNFNSSDDASVLDGDWITLGSTRRAYSCNHFFGINNPDGQGVRLEETWMVPGLQGLWKREAISRVTVGPEGLNVSLTGVNGLLMPGKLAIGDSGKTLLLVQCSTFLFFPLVSYTVLTRDMPLSPETEVEDIFTRYNVPTNIPSFYTVNHEGCDEALTFEQELGSNGLSSRRSVVSNPGISFPGFNRDPPFPFWNIRGSRDEAIVFD